MIKHVSLALNIRDGFKRRPIESVSGLVFTLNGQDVHPIFKEGGWCVFLDIPGGNHELRLDSGIFVPRKWNLKIQDPGKFYREEYVTLEPTRRYPFGRQVKQVDVRFFCGGNPLADQRIYLAADAAEQPLKLAQDGVKAGFETCRLFSSKKPGALELPDTFLVQDGSSSEVVIILSAGEDGEFVLCEPLVFSHNRGVSFRRVREYSTDAGGGIFIALENTDTFSAFWQGEGGFLSASGKLDSAREDCVAVEFREGL